MELQKLQYDLDCCPFRPSITVTPRRGQVSLASTVSLAVYFCHTSSPSHTRSDDKFKALQKHAIHTLLYRLTLPYIVLSCSTLDLFYYCQTEAEKRFFCVDIWESDNCLSVCLSVCLPPSSLSHSLSI